MARTSVELDVPAPVRRFLEGVESGDWDGMESCLTPDVLYDASVPGWHFQHQGPARVAEQYRQEWTGKHSWRMVELHVSPTTDGVVVDFEARGQCPGDDDHRPHEEAVRIANIFRLTNGRIAEHRFYCCGEWDEQTLRRIEAEAPRVERKEE
jgi:ketosteroid isomerase-like protein